MLICLQKVGEFGLREDSGDLSCLLSSHVLLFLSCTYYSKIVALSHPSGDLLWTSPALVGACQGTPHIDSSGDYVYVAHNSAGSTVGHFSVLITDQDGAVLFDMTDTNGPFSPPGIYHSPIEGNFAAGRGNDQDLLMWSYAPTPDATTGQSGSVFAFQLPFNYVQDLGTEILEVSTVIATVGWRSTTPPLLTGVGGLQLFWSVSRSQFRAWVNTRFSASSSGSAAFNRGSPSFLAPQNTPAVDDEMTPATLCAGTAGPEFVCMDATDINTGSLWSIDLAGLILANPLFSTQGDRVYFAEDRGVIFSVDPQTGDKYFEKSTGVPLTSNFALSDDGAFLYYGDQIGNVVAWKVAEEAVPPTPAPVAAPTASPTKEESSMAPSSEAQDTSAPTESPPTAAPPTNPRNEPSAPTPTAAPPTNAPPTEPETSGACRVAVVSTVLVGAAVAALV